MGTSAPSRSLGWPIVLNYVIAVGSAAAFAAAVGALYFSWSGALLLFLAVAVLLGLAAAIRELRRQNDRLRIENAGHSEDAAKARAAEQEIRLIVDTVPALIARYRPDGTMDFRNRNWREYTGLSEDNLEGRRWGSALHPDDEEMIEREWREHIATGESFELQQRLRSADGQYRWHRVRRVPLRGDTGEVIRWYAVAFDIDESKRSDDALRKSEAELAKARHELQLIIDTVPVLVLRHRADGIIDFVNEVGRVYSGLTTTKWTSRVSKITHPDDIPRLEASWDEALKTGAPFESEVRLRRFDGEYRWFATRRLPLRKDGEIVAWYAATYDIEDRKQAEAALREAERRNLDAQLQLAHANRIATMGQFAASIAHEVNQPIGATLVNAETALRWLAASPPKPESASQCLERIIADSKRGGDIIGRIRDLAKKAPAQREDLAINAIVLDVIGLTRSEISDRGVQVRTDFAQNLPSFPGDKVQLQQVILNLIMNAIEAMSEVADGPRELLISTASAEADGLLVTVSDTGSGVSSAGGARIFEAFYTTKPGGLGMGLLICRSIVEAHGGRLWATPNQPRGAVFRMMLPVGENSPDNPA